MSENNRGVVYLKPVNRATSFLAFTPRTTARNDFAGGIPLRKDGQDVGAIGVSGGSGEQDHALAEAGAAAY